MGNRDVFIRFYDWIQHRPSITIVPATRKLLEDGIYLYRYRRDKDWPLTDCISFVVMEDEKITDALTGDNILSRRVLTPCSNKPFDAPRNV